MKYLLARDNRELLARLAVSRVLLVFDFDGTLAPIVARRDEAGMRAETAHLLTKVCRLYPSAIISGRRRRDVTSRLDGAPLRHVVGNHGLEPGGDLPALEREVQRAGRILERAFSELPGVDLEDKRYSLALHYRSSRNRKLSRDLKPERLLGVRVGESRSSAAGYFLRHQLEINRLLARLVTLREGRSVS